VSPALKNFGIADKENVPYVGSNAKMNEFAAAMGLCNMNHLSEYIAKRKHLQMMLIKLVFMNYLKMHLLERILWNIWDLMIKLLILNY